MSQEVYVVQIKKLITEPVLCHAGIINYLKFGRSIVCKVGYIYVENIERERNKCIGCQFV